jgi:hypothetical protein
MGKKEIERWCILWSPGKKNKMTGDHIIFKDCIPKMFTSKKDCKKWIDQEYSYIKERKDLRAAPYYWRLPKPARITFYYDLPSKGALNELR